MRHPSVHLNGTSLEQLLENYSVAIKALREVELAVYGCAPHARDYCIQDGTALEEAETEHVQRIDWIRQARYELETIRQRLEDAQEERDRRQPPAMRALVAAAAEATEAFSEDELEEYSREEGYRADASPGGGR